MILLYFLIVIVILYYWIIFKIEPIKAFLSYSKSKLASTTRIRKWLLLLFEDRIIFPSQTIANKIELSKYKSHVMHPPLRLKINSPKEKINKKGKIKLLYVGILSERKNINYCVDILDRLPPCYYLTIVTPFIPDDYLYLKDHPRIHLRVGLTDQRVSNEHHQADMLLDLNSIISKSKISLLLSKLQGLKSKFGEAKPLGWK